MCDQSVIRTLDWTVKIPHLLTNLLLSLTVTMKNKISSSQQQQQQQAEDTNNIQQHTLSQNTSVGATSSDEIDEFDDIICHIS